MVKKILIGLVIITLLLLSGCTNIKYDYKNISQSLSVEGPYQINKNYVNGVLQNSIVTDTRTGKSITVSRSINSHSQLSKEELEKIN